MKTIILVLFCLSTTTHAGYFLEKSMYSPKHILVGKGLNQADARKDALSAMPKEKNGTQYIIDSNNSAANQCTDGGIPDKNLESCRAGIWQTTIPLVRLDLNL